MLLFAALFAGSFAFGAPSSLVSLPLQHEASPEEFSRALWANRNYHERAAFAPPTAMPARPVEDTAAFAYVLMSAYDYDMEEVVNLRSTIARNLPPGVRLVLLADEADASGVRAKYASWISPDRLIVATGASTQTGFWARDSFPVPVYDGAGPAASLVAAHYYRDFTAWDSVATAVRAPLAKKEFTFVGGNILADAHATCFSVDSFRLFTVTPADLSQAYGCRSQHWMPHLRGLGDVDEVLKPLPGGRMLTNSPEYRANLEAWGYKVVLLPTLPETYRTYVNSLLVGDTAFMPTYGVPEDEAATKVYEGLGYKVVGIPSVQLSDNMHGSVHCQTMAYPAMPLADLLGALGLEEAKR